MSCLPPLVIILAAVAAPDRPHASRHWADEPPRLTTPGSPAGLSNWARQAIDLFVLERLEREGLLPKPEAELATLARRVSLDLTGVPLDVDEIDALENETEPWRYERLVDRLLASPRFGERWAAWWLDLARYGDTNGYEADYERPIWLYRDWVIRAFNSGKPFDQFSIEQLAGDLLPAATESQRIATGFHRNTLINTEDGTKEDEFRDATMKDRVNTTFTVWMGSTIECAQCHDHKYDPVSQREYYQLYAFFNNTTDQSTKIAGVWESDTVAVFLGDADERSRLQNAATRADEAYDAQAAAPAEAVRRWLEVARGELERNALPWRALVPTNVRVEALARPRTLEDQSVLVTGPTEPRETIELATKPGPRTIRSLQLEVLPRPGGQEAGRGSGGSIALRGVEVQLRVAGDTKPRVLAIATAAVDRDGDGSDAAAAAAAAIDGKDDTVWTPGSGAVRLILRLAEPLEPGNDGELVVRAGFGSDAIPHGVHRLRLAATEVADATFGCGLPDQVRELLIAGHTSDASGSKVLVDYFRAVAPELLSVRAEREDARDRLAAFEARHTAKTMVLREGEPRITRRLERGDFLDPREEVAPGVPATHGLPLAASGAHPTRLDLARWLMDARNPRTARVTANRIWGLLFGRGIVETNEDFGVQGDRPSHPELLDWLALELVRLDWDLKAFLRAIVTSATYRQSSAATSQDLARDSYNRLLGRGARFRIEAEMVRDVALAAAGLLSNRLGGQSVFPPQPASIFENVFLHGPLSRWPTSEGDDRFRRALYTFLKRIAPHPMLRVFDAPNRSICTVRRGRSNTPLMALTTLNDLAFLEAAAGLARRMAAHPGSVDARIRHGFRLCVAREPRPDEHASLRQALESLQTAYAADPASAGALVKSATAALRSGSVDDGLAAWIVLANVLLNMDATLTRS